MYPHIQISQHRLLSKYTGISPTTVLRDLGPVDSRITCVDLQRKKGLGSRNASRWSRIMSFETLGAIKGEKEKEREGGREGGQEEGRVVGSERRRE